MKVSKRISGTIFCALIFICAARDFAQDWPQWRGPGRDGRVTGFRAPKVWPESLKKRWQVTIGSGDATPVLLDDKLYCFVRQGDEEIVLCLNAEDGKEMWRTGYTAQAVTGPGARHPGPRSTPCAADGKIATIGVAGVLSCIDLETHEIIWQKDPFPGVVPMFFTSMSPLITEGMVIAHLGGVGNGAVIACNIESGEEVWRWSLEGPDYSSPVLLKADGIEQIVTLTEKSIVGINMANGKLLWELPFVPQRRAYNAATPIIDGQTVIFTGAARGTKAVKIEKKGDGFEASEFWINPDISVQFNTPVLKEDLLYGLTSQGHLFCLNAGNGQTVWTDTTQNDRGGFAAMLNAGSVMMAVPGSSELIVFAPGNKQYKELARIKIADTPTYAHPVIAGNRIYMKDQETLTLWLIE